MKKTSVQLEGDNHICIHMDLLKRTCRLSKIESRVFICLLYKLTSNKFKKIVKRAIAVECDLDKANVSRAFSGLIDKKIIEQHESKPKKYRFCALNENSSIYDEEDDEDE